jgi:hypothetical protein
MARQRRTQIPPQQSAAAHFAAATRGGDQGALGLRAGAPAAQARGRARRLRGALLDRAAPPRADDLHRFRLFAASAAQSHPQAGGKGRPQSPRRDHRRNPACPRYAAPSPPGSSPISSDQNAVHTAAAACCLTDVKCQGSAKRDQPICCCRAARDRMRRDTSARPERAGPVGKRLAGSRGVHQEVGQERQGPARPERDRGRGDRQVRGAGQGPHGPANRTRAGRRADPTGVQRGQPGSR